MVIYGAPDKTAYQAWWGGLQPASACQSEGSSDSSLRARRFYGNNLAANSVFLHKHSARNSQIPSLGVVLGGHPDRPRFAAQEQTAQFSDAARHHSGHHHADRRHRPDPDRKSTRLNSSHLGIP